MDNEPIETFYQQPGAWAAAEEYQAKGYFTRVGRWNGEWALWVDNHDDLARHVPQNGRGSTVQAEELEVENV